MEQSTDRPTDRPTAIDLFCGLGGWTEGLLAEGYRVIGFDNEQHIYGAARYPAQLVIQDVLTIWCDELAADSWGMGQTSRQR